MNCHLDTRQPAQHADDFPPTNVQLLPDDEEGAHLENRASDDPNEAISFDVEVPGLGVKMRTIPQTKLFD
jgi:hypothetical protein